MGSSRKIIFALARKVIPKATPRQITQSAVRDSVAEHASMTLREAELALMISNSNNVRRRAGYSRRAGLFERVTPGRKTARGKRMER